MNGFPRAARVLARTLLTLALACPPMPILHAQTVAPDDWIPPSFVLRYPELSYSLPASFGIGLRGGVVTVAGDMQEPLKFEGTRTPWFPSGDVVMHWRPWRVNDSLRLGVEATAGFRRLGASNAQYAFRTEAWPATLAMTAELYPRAAMRPFLAFGFGVLPYELQVLRKEEITTTLEYTGPEKGVTFWVPVRLGATYALSRELDVQLVFERSITLSDRLDGFVSQKLTWLNDNFNMVSFGLVWYPRGDALLDRDDDGLGNADEEALGTNPDKRDSDGDGLADGDEVLRHRTNPIAADSDGDGLSDYDEINVFSTNPARRDTDRDGLDDRAEIGGLTDPLKPDTDGDGILDGADRCPRAAETFNGFEDEDGCPDTRPALVPSTRVPDYFRLGQIFVVENIEFELGKAVISPASEPELQRLAQTLRTHDDVYFEIGGHTDSTGQFDRNIALSLSRAESVRDYLVLQGVARERITVRGYGPTRPVETNATAEGRARNRRIEFRITRSGK
jgi:outer membrane protein OmpA-like peptidoglycan-associated protein